MAKSKSDVKVSKKRKKAETAPAPAGSQFWPLREEINRLFDEFDPARWNWPPGGRGFLPELAWPWAREGRLAPSMDLVERDAAFEISAELPGLAAEDIEIAMTDQTLTIRGEKREETERKEGSYHLSERRHGSFERSVHLPEGVDAAKISAKLANGVLTVTLPKTPDAKQAARKIKVAAG